MSFLVFLLLFIYLTNWQAVIAFINGSFFSSSKSVPYEDKRLSTLLKERTGISFRFKKATMNHYAGFSLLFPKNTIVFSSKLLADLTNDEMDWIALHEAGHRVYLHGIKYMLMSALFILIGFFVLKTINPLLLALILAPIYQQVHRFFEYQTDKYAAATMPSPQGMITANQKFAKATKSIFYKKDLLRTLFTPHISYSKRIQIAQDTIDDRIRKDK